jgi:hypothetical protein
MAETERLTVQMPAAVPVLPLRLPASAVPAAAAETVSQKPLGRGFFSPDSEQGCAHRRPMPRQDRLHTRD